MASPSAAEKARESEWAAIYKDLQSSLSAYGRENLFGDGDFLIIDDDYGSHQHKIECTSSTFFSPDVIVATQTILANYPPQWEVIFVATGGMSGSPAYIVHTESCALVT